MSEGEADPLADVDLDELSPDELDADEIRAALTSSNRLVRQRGARICVRLATEDPSHVLPHLDCLGAMLDDDSIVAAQQAATALIPVAREYPGELEGLLGGVISFADTDLGGDRSRAAKILADVVVERPDICAPHTAELLQVVRDAKSTLESDAASMASDDVTRETIRRHEETESQARFVSRVSLAHVVVAIAEEHPEAVAPCLDDLVALLDDDDSSIVAAALDALAEVAEFDPAAVSDHVSPVIDRLDHPADGIRARAIRTLGFTGNPDAVPALRSVAERDEDEDVRALAADTANFLETV